MIYVLVTKKNGEKFVVPFSKLRGISRYASDVLSGRKSLNAWKLEGTTHPVTGEKVLMRTRTVYNGDVLESMTVVKPREGADAEALEQLNPDAFVAVPEPQSAGYGTKEYETAYTQDGVTIPAGTILPVHRDTAASGEKYTILRAASGEGAVAELRHFFERMTPSQEFPGDGDDADNWDNDDSDDEE